MSKYKYEYILAFDPSGSFTEGKGTTGWVLMDAKTRLIARGYVSAEDYKCTEEYWNAVIDLINYNHKKYGANLIVVIEDYILYRERSMNQTNSKMETCRLIGAMQYICWRLKQDYSMQLAASVKDRWSDDLLLREQILYRDRNNLIHTDSNLSLGLSHTRDAFRHAIHYAICRNKERPKKKNNNAGVKKHGYFQRSNYMEAENGRY